MPEYFNAAEIFETWVGGFTPPWNLKALPLLLFYFLDPILVNWPTLFVISRAVQLVSKVRSFIKENFVSKLIQCPSREYILA